MGESKKPSSDDDLKRHLRISRDRREWAALIGRLYFLPLVGLLAVYLGYPGILSAVVRMILGSN